MDMRGADQGRLSGSSTGGGRAREKGQDCIADNRAFRDIALGCADRGIARMSKERLQRRLAVHSGGRRGRLWPSHGAGRSWDPGRAKAAAEGYPRSLVAQHRGRIVKVMGDGVLSSSPVPSMRWNAPAIFSAPGYGPRWSSCRIRASRNCDVGRAADPYLDSNIGVVNALGHDRFANCPRSGFHGAELSSAFSLLARIASQ
jgi:hypothetical protein